MNTAFWSKMSQRVFSRPYAALLAIYLLGLSSILQANRYYLDDLGRTLYGYADWLPSARPLTEILAWLFYLGPETLDASPLTQLVAIGLLALSSLLLLEAIGQRRTWWGVLCTVPVGLCPYGLENLSYKFDSPSMALGLLCAVAAACVLRRPSFRSLFYAAALLFASASLYQPALGAYLAICVYLALMDAVSRSTLKVLFRRMGAFIVPFVVGVGAYVLVAPLCFVPSEYTDYVKSHAVMPSPLAVPRVLLENIPIYKRLMLEDWSGNSKGALFAVLGVLFALALLARWQRSFCEALRRRGLGAIFPWFLRLLGLLVLLVCFWLTPFGMQLLLHSPVWAPRTFYSFGVMLALMLLQLQVFSKKQPYKAAGRIIQGLLVWQLLVFAQVYGNMTDNQNKWELTQMTALAVDLNSYIAQTGSNRITFIGSLGLAPLNRYSVSRYPLLGRLVVVPLTDTWRWGYEELKAFGVSLQAQTLLPDHAGKARTVFIKKPGYVIEQGPDDVGIVTFQPLPVAR